MLYPNLLSISKHLCGETKRNAIKINSEVAKGDFKATRSLLNGRKHEIWQGDMDELQGDMDELVNIATGDCASEEVVNALKSIESMGASISTRILYRQ